MPSSAIASLLLHLVPVAHALQLPAKATANAASSLRAILTAAGAPSSGSAEVEALMDTLTAARVPFDDALLGDGALWRAAYTRVPDGTAAPRWAQNAKLLPFFRNVAGQAYTIGPDGAASVVNYGEVMGRGLYFKAEGTFSEADERARTCPKDYDVSIVRGGLVVASRWPLLTEGISGPGYLRCLYIDGSVRIFESPAASPDTGQGGVWEDAGLQVVQVRDALFDDAVTGEL